jgi:hypothetical protein
MILTVDVGNTRIKAAVLRGYPCSILFLKEELKNIEIFFKKFTNTAHLVVGWKCRKKSLLSLKRGGSSFCSMMTTFLSLMGMKRHNLGIDRMVLLPSNLQFPGKNRLVMLELVSHLIL